MNQRYCIYLRAFAGAVTALLGGCFLDPCAISPLPGGSPTRPPECYPERHRASLLEYEKIARQTPFVCKAPLAPPVIPAETKPLYEYALYHDLHILNKHYQKHDTPVSKNTLASKAEIFPYLRYYHIAAANGNWMASERLLALYDIEDIRRQINDDGSYENPKYARFLADYRKQKPLLMEYMLAASLDPDIVRSFADKGLPQAMNQLLRMGGKDVYLSAEQKKAKKDWQAPIAACIRQSGAEQYTHAFAGTGYSPEELLKINQRIAQTGSINALLFLSKQFEAKPAFFWCEGGAPANSPDARRHSCQDGASANALTSTISRPDSERSRRYNQLALFFLEYSFFGESVGQFDVTPSSYSGKYASYKVFIDDLNAIAPLPPAELPEWDGKFTFQRWYEGPPPPKPSERLMRHLANKAGLDVHTGMDKSPKAARSAAK